MNTYSLVKDKLFDILYIDGAPISVISSNKNYVTVEHRSIHDPTDIQKSVISFYYSDRYHSDLNRNPSPVLQLSVGTGNHYGGARYLNYADAFDMFLQSPKEIDCTSFVVMPLRFITQGGLRELIAKYPVLSDCVSYRSHSLKFNALMFALVRSNFDSFKVYMRLTQ